MKGKGLEATYKFALFGLRGAGKTCLIVSLAAPRLAHPKKYSIHWVHENTSSESEIFMNESVKNLLNGTPIKKTEIGTGIRHFIFDFSTERDGRTRILLSDYAGELLNEAENETIAFELRKAMKEYDGILILSEYPRENQKNENFALPFNALRNAFSKITMEDSSINQRRVPIALLVNKWDRSGPISFDDPASEQKELEDFLAQNPSPPHKALFNTISNSVGSDNICIRPVSAFGESKSTQNADEDFREIIVLENGQVHSFGIEETMEWLVNRANELEFEKLKNRVVFEFGFNRLQALNKLKKRISSEVTYYSDLLNSIKNQRNYFLKNVGILCIIILFLIPSVEFLNDFSSKRSLSPSPDSQLTEEQLQVKANWLSDYVSASPIRHLFSRYSILPKSTAQLEIIKINKERLDRLFKTAKNTGNKEDWRIIIVKFPGSDEANIAQIELVKIDTIEKINSLKREIEKLKIAIKNLDPKGSDFDGKFTNLLNKVYDLSISFMKDTVDEEIIKNKTFIELEIANLELDLKKISKENLVGVKETEILMTLRKFVNLLESTSLPNAITFYSENKNLLKLEEVKKQIKKIGIPNLENKVMKEIKNKNFENALKEIELINNNVVLAKEIFDKDDISIINELEKSVHRSEESYRYEEFYSCAKDYKIGNDTDFIKSKILAYKNCKIKRKDPEEVVSKFEKVLVDYEKPFIPSFEIKEIGWGDNFYVNFTYSLKGKLVIKINGTEVLNSNNLETKPGDKTSKQIKFKSTVPLQLNDTITFSAEVTGIWSRGGISGIPLKGGSFTKKIVLKEFFDRTGYKIDATGGSDGNTSFTVYSNHPIVMPDLISILDLK